MQTPSVSCKDQDWLATAIQTMRAIGFVAVLDVAGEDFMARTREALYSAQAKVLRDVGQARLERAGPGRHTLP